MGQARSSSTQPVRKVVAAAVLAMALVSAQRADAADPAIKKFFGVYRGHTISAWGSGLSKRDLNIEIEPYEDDGFTVKWTTVLQKPGGKVNSKAFSVSFLPSERLGVYASAAKKDRFGQMRALNPFSGDPFVWAAIDGKTLTLRSLHISEGGGYEMQVYSRTLTAAGLTTYFERVRDGNVLKRVTGSLKRVLR